MSQWSRRDWTVIVTGLVLVQVITGAFSLTLGVAMDEGLNPFFLVSTSNIVIFFFLLPFVLALERKEWPRELPPAFLAKLILLSAGSVTAFQYLMATGVEMTSPAISTSMLNLSPGFIFLIATSLRMEEVNLKCFEGKAKMVGTLICLAGVLIMSLLQSSSSSSQPELTSGAGDWVSGCALLLVAAFTLSSCVVLQGRLLLQLPAPLTLSATVSLAGAILTVLVQLIVEGKIHVGSSSSSLDSIAVAFYVIAVGIVLGTCMGFQTWCVKKCGPVLPSMFSPIGTVSSAVLSAFVLGNRLSLGSMVGIVVMFLGLYLVLWAKIKEHSPLSGGGEQDKARSIDDLEQSLLPDLT